MLSAENVKVSYGKIEAVKGVSLDVQKGEIVALLGANGAGKSSLLNAIMGFVKIKEGKVVFEGEDVTRKSVWDRARMGIGIVPEGGRIFRSMTVRENLEMGAFLVKDRKEISKRMKRVFDIFPRLAERQKQLAMTLSGGEKQMLAIGRALMMNPKLILVDEISLGLMPKLVDEIFEILENLRKIGITILLSEQNTKKALEISERAYILQNGLIVKEGSSEDLIKDEEVKKAYLGL